ncbi:MAG: hypothetical protein J3Q66DRAFT_344923 [Benniella sp.]|nr:MAG: hypothetical protein J3Q66DRAFT_344923 [Benniella sp.]
MTRTSAGLLLACTLALASISAVSAQTASCVIATPQQPLKIGEQYTITFTGCQGRGNIQQRFGDVMNQSASETPACVDVDFSLGYCTYTPQKAGSFSFSTIDGSGVETFTGRFPINDPKQVLPKTGPKPKAHPSKPKKVTKKPAKKPAKKPTKKPAKKPVKKPVKKTAKPGKPGASHTPKAHPAQVMKAQKRALYDLATVLVR